MKYIRTIYWTIGACGAVTFITSAVLDDEKLFVIGLLCILVSSPLWLAPKSWQ